ncbi:MAG: hypothetical protein V4735_00840 [Pseudomonadota bacterium]
MTTPIEHPSEESTARAPLTPGPEDVVAGVAHPGPSHEATGDPLNPPGAIAKSVAHWVHQHPQAHKHGAGVLVYQFVRSAVAAVPYGLSMAATLAGITKMDRVGEAMVAKPGATAMAQRVGRTLSNFAKFPPAKWGLLIGTSFTFYRGTSKLGKWMTEYLFNPKDSEARTAEKVDDLPQEAWRKIKEIAPAEVSSTPVAAVVLGFIISAFTKPSAEALTVEVNGVKRSIDWTAANLKTVEGWGNKLRVMGSAIAHPSAKFIPQAAINSFGYALFFEMGDRLFKDTQIRRGVWPGEHHSIKALKAAPDEYEQGIKDGNENNNNKPKYADSALQAVSEQRHYGFFTNEPGLGRFIFRRLLPTAVGITAYTGVKMRWASMLGNHFDYGKGPLGKQFIGKALGEGAATSLFFLIPIVSEPWEKMYDTFFAAKEKKAQMRDHPEIATKVLTAHQEQKYDELLTRVTAKEREAANDGKYQQRA